MHSITVDLPLPPSTNRIWRVANNRSKRVVYPDPKYVAWKKLADVEFAKQRPAKFKQIKAEFELEMSIAFKSRGDLDNRLKPVLDWAQKAGIISNDKKCNRIVLERNEEVATGCRITFTATS